MKLSRPKNTKKKGLIEYIVYEESPKKFVGVCLTFDIVEEGTDPTALMAQIREAAGLHLETVRKHDYSDDLLNRHAPEEYWDKYFQAVNEMKKREPVASPFTVSVSPYSKSVRMSVV